MKFFLVARHLTQLLLYLLPGHCQPPVGSMKSDGVSKIPVRGTAMKKVARQANAIADCSTSDAVEFAIEASLPGIAQQTCCTFLDEPHQNVHQPLLVLGAVQQSDSEGLLTETVLPIAGRRTKDFCD